MKKLRWLTLLMGITLLVIIGFQVYWLKNNYDREKKTMQIKANVAFQETVRQLQTLKLKLKSPYFDSSYNGKTRVFVNQDVHEGPMKVKVFPREEVVTMVNSIRDKFKDSLKRNQKINSAVIVSMNRGDAFYEEDSIPGRPRRRQDGDIFQFLYGVDSLQDSLKVPEITKVYSKTLEEENLNVPFSISRLDSIKLGNGPDMSEVTVGFVHPITYHLELGNTVPYLFKKITAPILFSIFLVGVTILSFLLLYRNLLKQQRLAEIKNEFISNITHELKTPIATVGVAIEALKNFNAMDDPRKTKEYLDISSNELQRLSLLVDKVLKLSMFEKKEIELKYETFNLGDVVDEVVASMRLQIEKYNANVSVTTVGDTTLNADRLHLLSVVFNLLDNALKYSKDNPSIQIKLEEQGKNLQLSIEDNGIGIAPEYKNKIFEKFFRVPAGDTHNAKGYGLGLSYVSHVIQKHKGEISVESRPGIGTKFTLTLPKNNS